jgi:hypothetical protein
VINTYSEVVYVESVRDKHQYMIRRGKAKSSEFLKESANVLSEINQRVTKLIDHFKQKYMEDPSKRYWIKHLAQNYNSGILSEAAIDSRYTTFTVDKTDIHVCLRSRDSSEKVYNINLLMYVVLHELAHLCNYDRYDYPIQGHGAEFVNIFKVLVAEAVNIGVYDYTDYSHAPQEYCGIMINTSVLPEEKITFYLEQARKSD